MTDFYQQQPAQPIGYESRDPAKPHSGVGIASFILALLLGIVEFIAVVIAGIMASRPGGMNQKSPEAVVLGLVLCGGVIPMLLGIGLGIANLFQPNRKKLYGILGLCLNVAIILFLAGLMILGTLAKK